MRLVVALIACVAVIGCGANPAKPSFMNVTYRVTGSAGATRASITYANSSGTAQAGNALLPWSNVRTASTGDFLYVSAQNDGQAGCVVAAIEITGKPTISNQSCGAFVIATASGSAP